MAIQIPSGDNLGNVLPQVGRTRLSGNDGGVGQAMRYVGRELNGIALRLNAEKDQVNQVEMRNAVLNRQKQIDALNIDINDRVNKSELSPDKAVDEYNKQLAQLPRQQIDGMNKVQQEQYDYLNNQVDYKGQMQSFGIYQNGVKVKAQNAIAEYARLANEDPNMDIDVTLKGIDSPEMDSAITIVHGLASPEAKAALKREVLFNNLQNKGSIAATNNDYKSLKALKVNASNPDFYKGILQNDDRVKLAHSASIGMDRLESKWKAAQVQIKLKVAEEYNALTDSIYWKMAKDGVRFDELSDRELSQLNRRDYEDFKNYKTVKNDDLSILETATFKINNGEDVNLRDDVYRRNLTVSTLESLTKKKALLSVNSKQQQLIYKTNSIINTQAKIFGVKEGTQDYMTLQNSMNEAVTNESKKLGRPLTDQEQINIVKNQFVKVRIEGTGWALNNKKFLFQTTEEERKKIYIDDIDQVPKPLQKNIKKYLSDEGIIATNAEIINSYNVLLKGGYKK